MTDLKGTISEKDGVRIFSIDLEAAQQYPLKVVYKSLELLGRNNKDGSYFKFSDEIQDFFNTHKKEMKSLVREENPDFKDHSEIIFNYMKGPLFSHPEKLFEYVAKIYSLEPHFDNIQNIDVPQVLWNVRRDSSGFVVNVKNLDELTDKCGKAEVLHALILFKDSLNHEYNISHKEHKEHFNLNKDMFAHFYNPEKQSHEYLENFKDYFLTQFFDNGCKHIQSPEELLNLVVVREQVRKLDEPKSHKLKL